MTSDAAALARAQQALEEKDHRYRLLEQELCATKAELMQVRVELQVAESLDSKRLIDTANAPIFGIDRDGNVNEIKQVEIWSTIKPSKGVVHRTVAWPKCFCHRVNDPMRALVHQSSTCSTTSTSSKEHLANNDCDDVSEENLAHMMRRATM